MTDKLQWTPGRLCWRQSHGQIHRILRDWGAAATCVVNQLFIGTGMHACHPGGDWLSVDLSHNCFKTIGSVTLTTHAPKTPSDSFYAADAIPSTVYD